MKKNAGLPCISPRKPGEQIEVDWAGDPAHIIDPDTGEITDAWIFVGVLTYSQYAFVKAYMNEKTDNWIKAHVRCLISLAVSHLCSFLITVQPQ